MGTLSRREFIVASGAATAAGALAHARPAGSSWQPPGQRGGQGAGGEGDAHRGVCVVASANGLAATARAMDLLREGADPADAVVEGVKLVEDDPADNSVGYGGLPNEEGVVELDASVMHGPTHKAGAVAALRNIKNPAAVALRVLRRTDHVLLVGEGALEFARAHGFPEENLLTEESREAWLRWKENLSPEDDWLDDDQRDGPERAGRASGARRGPIPFTYGTLHCAAVTAGGDVGACTTTSGLSYKIPGRVGDSPIVGAGMYVDNAVGAAGATGRGEAVIQNCGAFSIVRQMEEGMTPTEACLAVARRIVDRTKEKRLLDGKGRPTFDVKLYALRKDGAYGSASIYQGGGLAVHNGETNLPVPGAFLFERE